MDHLWIYNYINDVPDIMDHGELLSSFLSDLSSYVYGSLTHNQNGQKNFGLF